MLEDKQIIDLYKSGNTEAIDILIERYKDSLYKFCYHLSPVRHDADDLFQDTWVKAVQHIETYDTGKRFNTWLFSICMNTYRDKYRKAKRWLDRVKVFFSNDEMQDEFDDMESPGIPVSEYMEIKEETKILRDSINSLDDTFRIPLILFYFKELSYEDISHILDIPEGTVKSRLNSGRAKLKKAMEVKGFGR